MVHFGRWSPANAADAPLPLPHCSSNLGRRCYYVSPSAAAMKRARLCTLLAAMHVIITCVCRGSRASNVSDEATLTPTPTTKDLPLGVAEALVGSPSPSLAGVAVDGTASTTARTDKPKLLGYIFDTHSSLKHHHHDHRWGPHFEDTANTTNMTVQVGSSASLSCRISLLQDKTVSWVRRNGDELKLLTVGLHTYSGDSRYSVEFQYPNNWRLQINNSNKRDEGLYECQISTHPPRVIQVNLHIKAPEVVIVDEHGRRLYEKYYKADSTIQLTCLVRHVSMTSSYVLWLHANNTLNYDLTRGGISVKTDLMEEGANSTLAVARADKADSGNYTCSISPTEYAIVAVHVLNGENPAELHHGSHGTKIVTLTWSLQIVLVLTTALLCR